MRDFAFTCVKDEQCLRDDGAKGTCEPAARQCSFPDPSCPSRRRFSSFGTEESCVPVPPACTTAGIVASANHTCAWFTNGRAACWGDNGNGQLGDGTTTTRASAKFVEGLTSVIGLSAGTTHVCADHADGTVSCWGANANAQLGDGMGAGAARSMPGKVAGLARSAALAAGGAHNCTRLADGSVSCWGQNTRGQLGDGTLMNRAAATAVPALRKDVTEVAAGDQHTCALTRAGAVLCWGSNTRSAVGPGLPVATPVLQPARVMNSPAAIHVAAGDNHTCAIAVDSSVLCWGDNTAGQLGDRALGKAADPTRVPMVGNVVDIDAGGLHSCAVLKDGTARCWGANSAGQIGNGQLDDFGFAQVVNIPVLRKVVAGARHTCALSQGGDVYCWGRTGEGQLGDDIPLVYLSPQPVDGLANTQSIAAGGSHSCGLTRDGKVWCWGRGDFGQLGNGVQRGDSSPVAVELPSPALQIATGSEFSCARLMEGQVMCWGRGTRGQLGNRAALDQSKPVPVVLPDRAVHIATGVEHACAVLESGELHCWGESQFGRLGNGVIATGVQNKPVKAQLAEEVMQVAAGNAHTCARTKTNAVVCFGSANYGQCGPAAGVNPTPSMPVTVAGLPEVIGIATGVDYTCAVAKDRDGTVWCWGRGDGGQLGFGTTTTGIAQPVQLSNIRAVVALAAGSNHTCAIRSDGTATCWGLNRYGQLGIGTSGGTNASRAPVAGLVGIVALDSGDRHTCAVTSDGQAYCWGHSQSGQLGNGAVLGRAEPRKVEGLSCK